MEKGKKEISVEVKEAVEAGIVQAKYDLEHQSDTAMWFMSKTMDPFGNFYKELQKITIENKISVSQLKEIVLSLDSEVLREKYGSQYDPDKLQDATVYPDQHFGYTTKGFLIPFEMFFEAFEGFKIPLLQPCKDCGLIHTIDNPKWFVEKGLHVPKRCEDCRAINKVLREKKPSELGEYFEIGGMSYIYDGKTLKPFWHNDMFTMSNADRWEVHLRSMKLMGLYDELVGASASTSSK